MRGALLLIGLMAAGCGGSDTAKPAAALSAALQPAPGAVDVRFTPGLQTFVIVPAESKASYVADEEFFAGALKRLGINAGKRKVVGSTQAIDGQFQLDPAQPAVRLGTNSFTVKMNTFTTDQPLRDKYLREDGPGFDSFPQAVFTATAIQGEGFEFKLTGNLTIREVSQPATFDVKAQLAGGTLTGVATTRLKMSDFGIWPPEFGNILTVADDFGIEVRFTARPPDPRGQP